MKNREKNGLPEIYSFFKTKFTKEEKESKAFIDYRKFSAIVKEFNQEIVRLIIEEAVEFKMPLRLGYLRIKKFKKKIRFNPDGTIDKKCMSIDWRSTKELWNKLYPGKDYTKLKEIPELKSVDHKPLVYHLNEHTDGYGFLLYWNKKGSNAANRGIYSMLFTSVNKKHLAEFIKGEHQIDYYE